MSQIFLRFLLRFSVIMIALGVCYSVKYFGDFERQKFSLLINFTCAIAKDELAKHPEMRTIAMVELENNFPRKFSREVLKCLPRDVAKIILNPHTHTAGNSTLMLPKQTMVIYIADKVYWEETFYFLRHNFDPNFPAVHHLAKFLIVSSDETKIRETKQVFKRILNVAQIYEENKKVIAKGFDMTKNLETFEPYENSNQENLSQLLYPDKAKNLNGMELFAVWSEDGFTNSNEGSNKPNNKWIFILDLIVERLNGSIIFSEVDHDEDTYDLEARLIHEMKLDFHLNDINEKNDLETYNIEAWCFIAPLPLKISITNRSRLTMKILLQLLIFTIFIFSNGYQSLVTSFMLNPMQEKLLKSIDEVLESDLNLRVSEDFKYIHKDNPKFQKAVQAGRVGAFGLYDSGKKYKTHMIERRVAIFQPCQDFKNMIQHSGDGKTSKGVYLIPEPVESLRNNIFSRPFHPFIDKFQEIIDQTFEAGLHEFYLKKYWKIWNGQFATKVEPEEEKEMLDFSLIAPFFLILAFGFSVGLFGFLCEIFYRDFVSELMRRRKLKKVMRKHKSNNSNRMAEKRLTEDLRIQSVPIKIFLTLENFTVQLLTLEDFHIIYKKLLTKLTNFPPDSKLKPKFSSFKFDDGTILVNCRNEFSAHWLKSISSTLQLNGKKFCCYAEGSLPEFPTFKFFICGQRLEFDLIQNLIQSQNVGLNTNYWQIMRREDEDNGQKIFAKVDFGSARALKNLKFEVACGLQMIKFELVDEKKDGSEIKSSSTRTKK